jgi:hypothetical protein
MLWNVSAAPGSTGYVVGQHYECLTNRTRVEEEQQDHYSKQPDLLALEFIYNNLSNPKLITNTVKVNPYAPSNTNKITICVH